MDLLFNYTKDLLDDQEKARVEKLLSENTEFAEEWAILSNTLNLQKAQDEAIHAYKDTLIFNSFMDSPMLPEDGFDREFEKIYDQFEKNRKKFVTLEEEVELIDTKETDIVTDLLMQLKLL